MSAGGAKALPVSARRALENRVALGEAAREDNAVAKYQTAFISFAGEGFGPAAEAKLVAALEGRFPGRHAQSSEALGDLALVLQDLRSARHRVDTRGELARFFRERGFHRLGLQGSLPASHCGYQLDQRAFQAGLKELASAGASHRKVLRTLEGQLGTLVDRYDIEWALRQISRHEQSGAIDGADARELRAVVGKQLPGMVPVGDVVDAMRRMRCEDFSAASVAAYKTLLDEGRSDGKALFFAQRIALRSLATLQAHPSHQAKEEQARLAAVKADLAAYFDVRTCNMFDNYAQTRLLWRMRGDGKLDTAQFEALRAAACTAKSAREFERGVVYVQRNFGLTLSFAQLYYKAQEEMFDAIIDNISGESAREREERYRIEDERQRLEEDDAKVREVPRVLGQRAVVRSRIEHGRAALATARGAEEKAESLGDIARAEATAADVAERAPITPGR